VKDLRNRGKIQEKKEDFRDRGKLEREVE
jgi:hypothetical protein